MLEAVSQLQNGLGLLSSLPEGQSRQQLELDLRVALQAALVATRGYAASEVDQNTTRARELCEQLSWPSQFVAVLYGQFVLRLCQRNDLALALEVADELYRFGEARNDDAIQLLALHTRGISHIGAANSSPAAMLTNKASRWMRVGIETFSAPWLQRIRM